MELVEKKYYNTQELAVLLRMSIQWVEKWRHMIVGARQVGRLWRFDKALVDSCVAKGKDVRMQKDLARAPRNIHIAYVHGAVRGGKKGRTTHGN